MKPLKIIGIVVFCVAVLGGTAFAAYLVGKSYANDTTTNSSNNTTNNNSSNNVQPKVVTTSTCNADELSLVVGDTSGTAGSTEIDIVFTNTGDRQCVLEGYPGVSLVNANGNQVGSPADRMSGATVQKVTLDMGQSTTAPVMFPEEGNFDAGTCQDGATKLRVYPPNDYGYLSVPTSITSWCPGFEVGTVGTNE